MRKCTYTTLNSSEEREGMFHCWISDVRGPCAIIELKNGRIVVALAILVVFTEGWEKPKPAHES